ncbi:D isomer specific 2 hydroxyacid dehydrogenase, partial [Aspergillus fumigatus]
MSRIKFAILDDYQNLSRKHFAHLTSRVDISYFPDTLDPRVPAQQQQLIARLQPFDAILAMRERTPFNAATIAALPNLKLLLTTGNRNLSLDLPALTARGIPVAGT